jgi:hypothetical protein
MPTSSSTRACWTPTPSAACTATRCASWTPRTRPCRRWWKRRRKLIDFLGAESLAHFDAVRAVLDAVGLPTASTRAWCAAWTTTTSPCSSGSPISWVAGHGLRRWALRRPDSSNWVARARPAVGLGLGMERLLLLLQALGLPVPDASPDAYAIVPPGAPLRRSWLCWRPCARRACGCNMHAAARTGMGSMKSQFKKADASGAALCPDFRRRRAGAGHGHRQGAARWRGCTGPAAAGRHCGLGGLSTIHGLIPTPHGKTPRPRRTGTA